uniref:EF-hand domain-containing protein n=1 Tax=Strix occidentalis caurina TaxID=311401 RepID=A0A8D0KPH7_STROC
QDRELRSEEIEELKQAFREFDKDHDGYISYKDLGECMRTMGYMPTEMELIELSQQISTWRGGPSALLAAGQAPGDPCPPFDTNGDGQISMAELREAMRKLLGQQLNYREVDEILKDVDLNGDGLVDFEGKGLGGGWEHPREYSGCFVRVFLPAEFVRMMSR